MCGICGKYSKENVGKQEIISMCSRIIHRGPDEEGTYLTGRVGLGMRRLSIIGLQKGSQPIYNEDKSVVVVYNGEMYNFPELKLELEKKGHKFYSDTDTEVIVHAYEEYGYDCLNKFNGMFAFALYDENKKTLFIARDRVGIKPLYYHCDSENFLFGSEIKTFIREIKTSINPQAIAYYLGYDYIPGPDTIFNEVKKLLPGHYLIYNGKELVIKKYWDITDFNLIKESKETISKKLLELTKDSVKRQMISDVPLGVFISGGIDSTAITALASQHTERLKTFSIGFEEKEYNELEHANYVANYFNTDHHEFVHKADDFKLIDKALSYFDEPISNVSILPMYLLTQMARKYVKVVLEGDGADELFGGYYRYRANQMSRYYNKLPTFARSMIKNFAELLPSKSHSSFGNNLKSFVKNAELPKEAMHVRFQQAPSEREIKEMISPEMQSKINFKLYEPITRYSNCEDSLQRELYVDFKTYLVDNLLAKTDQVSMSNSLEIRVPILDHRIAEYAFKIPSSLKNGIGIKNKFIWMLTIKNLIPKKILHRKKKGFLVPLERWVSSDIMKNMTESLISSDLIKNKILSREFVNKTVNSDKNFDNGNMIFRLYCLNNWYNNYLQFNRSWFHCK